MIRTGGIECSTDKKHFAFNDDGMYMAVCISKDANVRIIPLRTARAPLYRKDKRNVWQSIKMSIRFGHNGGPPKREKKREWKNKRESIDNSCRDRERDTKCPDESPSDDFIVGCRIRCGERRQSMFARDVYANQ